MARLIPIMEVIAKYALSIAAAVAILRVVYVHELYLIL
jgi:hypothetical protein